MRINSKYLSQFKTDWTTATTSLVINHGLGSKDLLVQARDLNDDTFVILGSITYTDENSITVEVEEAPTGAGFRIMILAI